MMDLNGFEWSKNQKLPRPSFVFLGHWAALNFHADVARRRKIGIRITV
jgi:hypothetical protein